MSGNKTDMPSEPMDEILLVRYLLGDLSQEEQVQVEDRAFADPEYLVVLQAVEVDLIDAYVNGELSPEERCGFERQFLASPERRRKVAFARDLARVAAEAKGSEVSPALRGTASRGPAPLAASLVLLPGLSRAEIRREQLVLNPGTEIAHIEVQLEARDDYPRFRAELRTLSGAEVLSLDSLSRRRVAAGYAVSFDVPASALSADQYELALKGVLNDQTVQDVGYYYFSVQKQ
jgi:hypothetical protein